MDFLSPTEPVSAPHGQAAAQEKIMATRTLFHRPGAFARRKSRSLDAASLRIDLIVGSLAACAIVAFFIVAYFAFAPLAPAP
jgi:hypothetical protein